MRPIDPWEGYYADVRLLAVGPDRIATIRVVRDLLGWPLQSAKALVEQCPVLVLEGAERERAEEAVRRLEAVGARARVE